MSRPSPALFVIVCLAALAGCEQLGIPDPKHAAAEGQAIGAACRQAGRALEDCYQLNPSAPKSAVFSGWREMNDYMTVHKIADVKPLLPPQLPKSLKGKIQDSGDGEADSKESSGETDKTTDKTDAASSKP
ncbi:hypothetical protein [Niveibacterium terrae]|uniref:hypothetical protein n=1 Tax=Niveibacterium terrae TaxID=3373598 RepID=UPI003A8DFA0A